MALEGYPESNSEPHPHEISYERLRAALAPDDAFGHKLLSDAIGKHSRGWQPTRDEVARAASKMRVGARCRHEVDDSRAWGTAWVDFESPLAGTSISWKPGQSLVVLGFSGWGRSIDAPKELVGEIAQDAHWRKPKKGETV